MQPLMQIGVSTVGYGSNLSGFLGDGTTTPNSATLSQLSVCTLLMHPVRHVGIEAIGATSIAVSDMYPATSSTANIATSFSRYEVVGGKFTLHYAPQQTTATGTRYVLSFVNDPYHPSMGGRAYEAGRYLTQNVIDEGDDNVSFAPWLPWSRTFTCEPESLFTYYPSRASASVVVPTTGYFNAYESIRKNSFGSLNCIADNASANRTDGMLFLEITYDFYDFAYLGGSHPFMPTFRAACGEMQPLHDLAIALQRPQPFRAPIGVDHGPEPVDEGKDEGKEEAPLLDPPVLVRAPAYSLPTPAGAPPSAPGWFSRPVPTEIARPPNAKGKQS
jgi:hypothetical protein